jgi:putative membrane protein
MDSKEVAKELNEPKDDVTKERDEKFMVDAAEMNFQAIMLSQLAQERSTDQKVKSLAKNLVDTHQKMNTDLQSLGSQKSIAVPTAATNEVMNDYNQLSDKTPKDFDNAYLNMILDNHQDAIDRFENYTSGNCDNCDEGIKVWAMGLIPDMRIHLQEIKDLKQSLSSPVSEAVK